MAAETDRQFKQVLAACAKANGWKFSRLRKQEAVLAFLMPAGHNQTIYFSDFGDGIEIAVLTNGVFDSLEDFPHPLSTFLLYQNANHTIGYWCVEDVDDKVVISYMHNIALSQLSPELFRRIVETLVQECDTFNLMLPHLLDESADHDPLNP
jgi:hypothetical protein